MSWETRGAAIQRAIEVASGLGPGKVIWKSQNANAPNQTYVAISLGGALTLGHDYLKMSLDENRPRGQEFMIEVKGQREVPLTIEAFTDDSVVAHDAAALALCARITAALVLPSVRGILQDEDVSPFDPGNVQWIPDVPSINFRGRAVAVVRCYMPPPTVREYVGFIERMSGTVTMLGGASGPITTPFDTASDEGASLIIGADEDEEDA